MLKRPNFFICFILFNNEFDQAKKILKKTYKHNRNASIFSFLQSVREIHSGHTISHNKGTHMVNIFVHNQTFETDDLTKLV